MHLRPSACSRAFVHRRHLFHLVAHVHHRQLRVGRCQIHVQKHWLPDLLELFSLPERVGARAVDWVLRVDTEDEVASALAAVVLRRERILGPDQQVQRHLPKEVGEDDSVSWVGGTRVEVWDGHHDSRVGSTVREIGFSVAT
eukprot:3923323-Rhodomonas_salina.2